MATISEAADDQNRGKIIGLSNLLWLVGIGATMGVSALVGDWGKIGAQIMYMHVGLVALVLMSLRWSIPESPLWLVACDELRRGVATVRAQKNGWRDLLERKYLWPFLSLCAFYTFTNLAANTGGQFWYLPLPVNVVGISVSTNSLWGLLILPVSVGSGLIFMRIVDTAKRIPFFVFGAVMMSVGYFAPVVLNFSPLSWFCCLLFTNIGTGFAFEGIMKVWAQESFPTMLRATAQGVIVGVARLTCGLLALVTPVLLSAGPMVLYCLLTTIVVVGMVIGWLCFHGKQRNEFNDEAEIVSHQPARDARCGEYARLIIEGITMLAVERITLDYESTLSGCETLPVLGWIIASAQRNVEQTQWRVQIAQCADFATLCYDSGEVQSEESNNTRAPRDAADVLGILLRAGENPRQPGGAERLESGGALSYRLARRAVAGCLYLGGNACRQRQIKRNLAASCVFPATCAGDCLCGYPYQRAGTLSALSQRPAGGPG
ncbi:MFS transporter [Citrobacter enshiensis]|uniref:MFS transporter n=1 Tax=Citrobacter enshiensis TaxID=2971264 RepID=UPI0023E8FABC|nr:MFS transporter [Citrobacter enshiensis]WET42364.1 MFS transporter [Citrobacter enshiensis]